ncbi:MAG: hypothetical protein QW745_08790 [Thermoplasmata archaeon]
MSEIYKNANFQIETYTGPGSYQPGGFTVVTSTGPSLLLNAIVVQTSGGYNAYAKNITSNQFTIQVYSSGGTEVLSGTNLTNIVFTVFEFGYGY